MAALRALAVGIYDAPMECEDRSRPDWLTGQLLVAMPAMRDSRFAQSVIFMCAHTAEGAMGVVLNQPLRAPKFVSLLEQLGVAPHPPARALPLGAGGPVDDNRGFVLHSPDWSSPASMAVDDRYLLTADMEILQAVAAGGGPARAVMLLGYAGWGAGQLDDEIRGNSWLSVPADEALVYDSAHATKWSRAMAILRVDPGMLSGLAGRA